MSMIGGTVAAVVRTYMYVLSATEAEPVSYDDIIGNLADDGMGDVSEFTVRRYLDTIMSIDPLIRCGRSKDKRKNRAGAAPMAFWNEG